MSELEDNIKSIETGNEDDSEEEEKTDETLVFNDEEMQVFDKVQEELEIDETTHKDLEEGLPEIPNLTSEELDETIKDPKIKSLLKEENNNPTIYDTLEKGDEVSKMKKEDIAKLRKDLVEEKQNLMVYLGSQPTIKLHLNVGKKDGKNLWVEKEFPFNSMDKREEFHLNVLKARLATMNVKYNIVGAKSPLALNRVEVNFVSKGAIMIEIAGYRLGEKEAFLKLGMSDVDYARVDTDQYKIALLAWAWRSQNVPYYKQRR